MSTAAIFPWLGWTLAGAGALLVVWALLWDRARGRRRCSGCWYDMSAAAAFPATCAECGRVSRTARALARTRRRWRWAALGMVAMIGAWFVAHTPAMRERGWAAGVPTEALVRWAPLPARGWEPVPPHPLCDELSHSLESYASDRLSPRQWWLLMRRYGAAEPTEASIFVQTRPIWPEGVTPRVVFQPPGWLQCISDLTLALRNIETESTITRMRRPAFGVVFRVDPHHYRDATVELPHTHATHAEFELAIIEQSEDGPGWQRLWRPRQRLEWRHAPSIDDVLTGVESDAVAAAMRGEILASVRVVAGEATSVTLWGLDRIGDALHDIGSPTLAGRVAVLRGGVEVGAADVWWTSRDRYVFDPGSVLYWSLSQFLIPLVVVNGGEPVESSAGPDWSVRFVASSEIALRDFETKTFWQGEITLPVAHIEDDRIAGGHWLNNAVSSHPQYQQFLSDMDIPASVIDD